MFVTEFMAAYPKATVYDRSDRFRKAVNSEITLGKSDLASPSFHRQALKAEKNLNNPAAVDVTVDFFQVDEVEHITISGRSSKVALATNVGDMIELPDLEAFIKKLIAAVGNAR